MAAVVRMARKGAALAVPAPVKERLYLAASLLRREGSPFVSGYTDGLRGVEIGAAAHNRYWLDAINVDRSSSYKWTQRRMVGHSARIDVVGRGDRLPFADGAFDYVFSSHVIEHSYDPVTVLREWGRVASKYVIAVVPHRDRTFEAGRPATTAAELEERMRSPHPPDAENEFHHWTTWTREAFVEVCEHFGFPVVDSIDPDDKVGNGFVVVIDAAG